MTLYISNLKIPEANVRIDSTQQLTICQYASYIVKYSRTSKKVCSRDSSWFNRFPKLRVHKPLLAKVTHRASNPSYIQTSVKRNPYECIIYGPVKKLVD